MKGMSTILGSQMLSDASAFVQSLDSTFGGFREKADRTYELLKRRGITGLPVHFLGKAATFNLLYAFPLLLLGDGATGSGVTLADVARVVGWAFAIWGTALYWWAGILYLEQTRRILRTPPR